ARQPERTDARSRHLEARPGAELGDHAGRGRTLDRGRAAGAGLRPAAPSAADLKFPHPLRQAHLGTSNRKAALESYACQYPFASEARVRGCRNGSRTSEAGTGCGARLITATPSPQCGSKPSTNDPAAQRAGPEDAMARNPKAEAALGLH